MHLLLCPPCHSSPPQPLLLVKPESAAIPSAVQSLSQHIIPSAPAKSWGAPSQSTAYHLVLTPVTKDHDTQNGVSSIMTADLARDLSPELVLLLLVWFSLAS
ncbi:hypothetical protein BDR05DRAFT_960048 [Suillus weaverae]|nr:hypothetical protein BDR05DRAFT_960048 [Suillus weaverae]